MDLPARHRGVLFEQLHLATVIPTFAMRGLGLCLPGQARVPTQPEIFEHLCTLANNALQGYLEAARLADGNPANEIWGDDSDSVFRVEITGMSAAETDGYTIDVELNILNLLHI